MRKYLMCFFVPLLLSIAACEEVIEKKDLTGVDNTIVWNDPEVANLFLNNLYSSVIPGFGGNANTSISDESFGAGPGNMMYGLLVPSTAYGIFGSATYRNIRNLNLLLDEVEKGSIEDLEKRDVIIGQASFLRAWVYWELVKYYGGVPIVLEVQDPFAGDDLYVERSSAAACIEVIEKDLDRALELLPSSWPAGEYGRVTRAAAAALKGRVLLFYASPQFNPNNSPERWTAAYEANKQARQIAEEDGYELYNNFEEIFIDEEKSKEGIFMTRYGGTLTHGYENSVRPASVSASGSTSGNPTWEFVQAFPMADGKSIEGHPAYDQETFWENRDPRFYATVAYNGMEWVFADRDNYTRQWTYVQNDQEIAMNTRTGFYVRKNVNESIEKNNTGNTATDWIEIRFAEVLLNLAESANEAGHTDEAYDILKEIRERAGIEEGSDGMYGLEPGMSVEEMRDAIMLERQIELAYENKRHWDLRRRNLFDEELNGTRRTGISTQLDTAYIKTLTGLYGDEAFAHFEAEMRDTIDWENPDNFNLYFNTEYGINLDERDINYLQPKYNFYYIPQTDLDKNPLLKQTVRWGSADTFDPLNP